MKSNHEPKPLAYPLDWPHGWPRLTPVRRKHSPFYRVTFTGAREELFAELGAAKARYIVLSTNVPVNRTGQPTTTYREPADPGVALYWRDTRDVDRVIACDHWKSTCENLHAIGMTYAAFRMLERAGAPSLTDRVSDVFKRLPPPSLIEPWWQVLQLAKPPTHRNALRARFREMALTHHPNHGGDAQRFAIISAAYHLGLKETPD